MEFTRDLKSSMCSAELWARWILEDIFKHEDVKPCLHDVLCDYNILSKWIEEYQKRYNPSEEFIISYLVDERLTELWLTDIPFEGYWVIKIKDRVINYRKY